MESPIQLSESDWQEARRVLTEALPGTEIWAFGSRARHTAKPYSDLDLAIIRDQPLTLTELATVIHAFDASDMRIRVDLVDWASASEAFRKIIANDKVVVQTTQT